MKPILIIKAGTTLRSIPRERGDFEQWIMTGTRLPHARFIVRDVMAGERLPSCAEVAGILITGSAAMVTDRLAWSEYTAAFLRDAALCKTPLLGICYGHQLLAHALGGVVDYHPAGWEMGTTNIQLTAAVMSDPLFADLPMQFPVNVSHRQSVVRLPEGAEILAANSFEPHQAVRFASNVWGVQFHPEFAEDIIHYYLAGRGDVLRAEGLDVEDLQANVRPTPVAESLLCKFGQLAYEACGANPSEAD